MGSSSWAGWSGAVSTPGGGAPARRRARMSASVGGAEVLELGERRVEGSSAEGSGKVGGAGQGGAVSSCYL